SEMGRIEEHIDALAMIVRLYERMRDYKETLKVGLEAMRISEASHRNRDFSFFANAVGTAYLYLGDYSEALNLYQEVLQVNRQINDKHSISVAINNIGNVYLRLGNNEKALDHYLQSLRLKEETGESQVNIINSIGNVYLVMHDYDRALECHQQALSLYRENGDNIRAIQVMNNIGLSLKNLKHYGKSVAIFQQALDEAAELPYANMTARTINNLGLLQREMGEFDKSLVSFRLSLEMKREMDDPAGLAASLLNIGHTLKLREDFEEAEEALQEGLEIARSLNSREMMREGMELLASLHLREAELADDSGCRSWYRAACANLEEALGLADDIWQSKSSRYLVDMQVRFEIEEHERETELYRQKTAALAEANAMLEKANEKLELLALTDELTRLANRRDMILNLERELIRSQRSKKPFSVIICDIDHFKLFNDTHGHDCGDYVLQAVSQTLRDTIRRQDYISRWGGEEFMFMLPETLIKGSSILANKLRRKIDDTVYTWQDESLHISLTFGVAEYPGTGEIDEVIKRADEALYAGKHDGRNCVFSYPNDCAQPQRHNPS
ncbi:MAG: GGDEF domain-containing protein, partial [Candidatus Cloacimonetes bacterium]|nr:GGDEF domain-containing protein [Candidatus Cloacimonadota bacterium]